MISLSFCKVVESGVSNHRSSCGEKKLGKLNWKNCFLDQFWTLRKKKLGPSAKQYGMIRKTVAYLCRWPFSENFPEANFFVWTLSVNERKHRISGENVFSGLSKAHFECPVQYFEKNMMKVKFTSCALFSNLCVFFCSEEKVSQGCQNHKLIVQRKKLRKNFSNTNDFSKYFWIFCRETWSFSGKLDAWLSNLHFMGREKPFQSNVFEASL